MKILSTEDASQNVTCPSNPRVEPTPNLRPQSSPLRSWVSDYSQEKLKALIIIVIVAIVLVSCLTSWLITLANFGE